MDKQELKNQLRDYIMNLTEKLLKAIDAFPDEVEWGWMEVLHAIKYCIGYGYNQPVEKIIANIKLSDKKTEWPPMSNDYTFQNETKEGTNEN